MTEVIVHARPNITSRFAQKAKVIKMATGGNVPELGGYDYEFTSKVPEDLECLVCQLTLKDPVQIMGCGHRLCKICMESLWRRPSPACPADRKPLSSEKIFPDAACHRKILDLTVKCSHSGCSWTGELRAVEKHQSECLFKVVKCPNSGCTEMLSKRDMKTHETFECSWRKVNCEYCQESVIINQRQKHLDVCRKFPVVCTNKCGLRDIPREKLEVHVRDECPETIVQCIHKNLGCEAVFSRSNVKSHSQTQVESHLNLALRGLEATQHQELVNVVKNQSQQIERLISKDKEQSQQIERQSGQIWSLISKDREQSQQIERQSQQIERQSGQIERLISELKEQSEQIERLLPTVQDQPLQRERHGPIDQIYSTPFEWKIPNFKAFCTRGKFVKQSLVSEPFYLFKRGYKYLLKDEIYLDPWGIKVGLHSVYVKVVPGEFDSFLLWPCKEKVRVTLIDQDPLPHNRENISHVIDFEKNEGPCCRPLRDDHHEYRYVLGLEEHVLKSQSYIKDDSILIMVNRE